MDNAIMIYNSFTSMPYQCITAHVIIAWVIL